MGQLRIEGTLTAGPATVSDGVFPGAVMTAPLAMLATPKIFGVATGILTRQLNSPAAFTPLQGVGPTDTVTRGDTLYFKSSSAIDLRLSLDNGAGGTDLRIITVHGICVLEFSSIKYLKLLEAQGSGTLEYFVSGAS